GRRAGPSSVAQRLERARGDLVHAAQTVDGTVLGRVGRVDAGPVAVVVHQRARLVAVDLQALLDGFFAVVVALHQRLAGQVVLAGDLGRVELHVVGAPGRRVAA